MTLNTTLHDNDYMGEMSIITQSTFKQIHVDPEIAVISKEICFNILNNICSTEHDSNHSYTKLVNETFVVSLSDGLVHVWWPNAGIVYMPDWHMSD